MNEELQAAYAHCAAITRRRARNFYYGLRLTPEPRRSALYSVYAWMRRADDSVDDAGDADQKIARLDRVRDDLERILAGGPETAPGADPVMLALAHTVASFDIDHADLRHLLRGLQTDLEIETRLTTPDHPACVCETDADLESYCHDVAATVGRISVSIWGLRENARRERAMDLAARRGFAFQITNILRDFAEDYDEGRVYLPSDAFGCAGIRPVELRRWSAPDACERFILGFTARAREQYSASEPLDAMIDPACVSAMSTMTRIYSGLLNLIEAEPRRIVGPRRVRLQSVHKASIAIRSVFGAWREQRTSASTS